MTVDNLHNHDPLSKCLKVVRGLQARLKVLLDLFLDSQAHMTSARMFPVQGPETSTTDAAQQPPNSRKPTVFSKKKNTKRVFVKPNESRAMKELKSRVKLRREEEAQKNMQKEINDGTSSSSLSGPEIFWSLMAVSSRPSLSSLSSSPSSRPRLQPPNSRNDDDRKWGTPPVPLSRRGKRAAAKASTKTARDKKAAQSVDNNKQVTSKL